MRSALLVLVLAACLPGDGTGVVLDDEATLTADVQPIFTGNCALSGCHAAPMPVLGQNLSAGAAWGSIVNVPSQERPGMNRVEPGLPDSSYLVHKIQGTHLAVGGDGLRMPRGGAPLSAAEIATIRAWIAGGALDN